MESIELVPDASIIRLSGNVELEHVYQRAGKLRGFRDAPVTLQSDNGGSVRVTLANRGPRTAPHQVLSVSPSGVYFDGVTSFTVTDPTSDKMVFSTSNPEYNMPSPSKSLSVKVSSLILI